MCGRGAGAALRGFTAGARKCTLAAGRVFRHVTTWVTPTGVGSMHHAGWERLHQYVQLAGIRLPRRGAGRYDAANLAELSTYAFPRRLSRVS
jgi:hypothetical protein